MQNSVLTTKLSLTGHSSAARQCHTSFWVVLYSFSYRSWRGGQRCVNSCFSRPKCNWVSLHVTAWVFVDVEWELGTPVADHSTRHCSPSLRHVSYPAPQSPLTAVGTAFVFSMKDSHTTPSIALSVLWCTDAHRNTMEAKWKHVKVHLSPYWESEVKCVIYRVKGSLSAEFSVPELNVKHCV